MADYTLPVRANNWGELVQTVRDNPHMGAATAKDAAVLAKKELERNGLTPKDVSWQLDLEVHFSRRYDPDKGRDTFELLGIGVGGNQFAKMDRWDG